MKGPLEQFNRFQMKLFIAPNINSMLECYRERGISLGGAERIGLVFFPFRREGAHEAYYVFNCSANKAVTSMTIYLASVSGNDLLLFEHHSLR